MVAYKPMKNKKLLFSVSIKDCEVQTFRSGGKGGQNQNKVESGVRVIHHPSGAVGEARDSRDQPVNKKNAFLRMVDSKRFQSWLKLEAARLMCGKTIDDIVEEQMHESNIKLEVRDENGRWIDIPNDTTLLQHLDRTVE